MGRKRVRAGRGISRPAAEPGCAKQEPHASGAERTEALGVQLLADGANAGLTGLALLELEVELLLQVDDV